MAELDDDGDWVDLLLTDSLDRPLGNAPYILDRGASFELEHGSLTLGGRVTFRWPEGATTVDMLVCHRTLVFSKGPGSGTEWDRNRLTNLGFDAGTPREPPNLARVEAALAAFAAIVSASGGQRSVARAARARRDRSASDAGSAVDAHSLLDTWYRGEAGLAPVLRAARNRAPSPPGRFRRWLSRRLSARAQAERSGSHLAERSERGGRRVAIALTTGAANSPEARNRVVVFDWFSGFGTPPRPRNRVELLVDGEQAWGAVADDLEAAESEVCISSWFTDPDIELKRPPALSLSNPDARQRFRLSVILETIAQRGVSTAILIWNWVSTPLTHPTLRKWALTPDDGIEVLQHRHPQLLGSFHEKTIVVDRKVAYCGGFNLRQNDWDTQEHRVDDPRRNPHATSGWDRRVSEPIYPPRHDMALRMEGPIVGDIHENFVRHWNGTLRADRRLLRRWLGRLLATLFGAGPATPLVPMKELPPGRGDVLAQFVRTDPRLPRRHQAIVDVSLRAILNARRLIYIENQFFRSPRVTDALVMAMRKRPKLEVIVVTNEIGPPLRSFNPFAYWTRKAQEALQEVRPDFRLYSLVACGILDGTVVYRPVFLHAKVMVIDDEWATVGSANINDRSIYSEFEANVAIEDEEIASGIRRRLMAEHLGLPSAEPRLEGMKEAAECWRTLADENARAFREHRLAPGRAQPFVQKGGLHLLRGRPHWF